MDSYRKQWRTWHIEIWRIFKQLLPRYEASYCTGRKDGNYIRIKLLDLSNTSNIFDSYESLQDPSLQVDEPGENYHQSEIKSSAEGNEAEHDYCHRKYMSAHGKVDVTTGTFPLSPQVFPWRIEVNKMAAQMHELRSLYSWLYGRFCQALYTTQTGRAYFAYRH